MKRRSNTKDTRTNYKAKIWIIKPAITGNNHKREIILIYTIALLDRLTTISHALTAMLQARLFKHCLILVFPSLLMRGPFMNFWSTTLVLKNYRTSTFAIVVKRVPRNPQNLLSCGKPQSF